MKLSLSENCYTTSFKKGAMNIYSFIEMAYNLGFEGIEISPTHVFKNEDEITDKLKDFDLGLILSDIVDISNASSNITVANMKRAFKIINLAQKTNAYLVKFAFYTDHHIKPIKQMISVSSKNLLKLCKMAQKNKISLAVENHGIIKTDVILEILKICDSDNIGLAFDTMNQIILGEDTLDLFNKFINNIVHFHAKDYIFIFFPKIEIKPVPIGDGILDFEYILKKLSKTNYNGYITIERGLGCEVEEMEYVRKSFLYLSNKMEGL